MKILLSILLLLVTALPSFAQCACAAVQGACTCQNCQCGQQAQSTPSARILSYSVPTISYSVPVVSYYQAPTVSYYQAPTISYSVPVVSYYQAPTVSYYQAPRIIPSVNYSIGNYTYQPAVLPRNRGYVPTNVVAPAAACGS